MTAASPREAAHPQGAGAAQEGAVPSAFGDPQREAAPPAHAEGPGLRLQSERRAQGLSLGDIARQLKLSVRQVEALEHDDYSGFPGAVFVRGFLRNYAKLLRLDLDKAIVRATAPALRQDPAEPKAGEDPEPVAITAAGKRKAWIGGLAAVLVGALILAMFRGGRHEPAPPVDGVAVRVPPTPHAPRPDARPLNPAAGPIGVERGSSDQTRAPGVNLLTGRSPAAVNSPSAAAQASGDVHGGSDPQIAPELNTGTASSADAPIRLVFNEESWVEVTDRWGEVVFSRLSPAGTTRLVRGEPPFSMVIGNARGVRVYFQDKRIDLGPHTRIDVARVVLE